jgi:hypothetical protein
LGWPLTANLNSNLKEAQELKILEEEARRSQKKKILEELRRKDPRRRKEEEGGRRIWKGEKDKKEE